MYYLKKMFLMMNLINNLCNLYGNHLKEEEVINTSNELLVTRLQ